MCEIHDTVQAGSIIIITDTISGSPIKFEPICGLKLNSFEVKLRFLSAVCLLLHQLFSHQRLVTVRSGFSCYKYDLSLSFQQNTWESQRGYFTASHHVSTKGTKGLLSRVQSAVVCQNNLCCGVSEDTQQFLNHFSGENNNNHLRWAQKHQNLTVRMKIVRLLMSPRDGSVSVTEWCM